MRYSELPIEHLNPRQPLMLSLRLTVFATVALTACLASSFAFSGEEHEEVQPYKFDLSCALVFHCEISQNRGPFQPCNGNGYRSTEHLSIDLNSMTYMNRTADKADHGPFKILSVSSKEIVLERKKEGTALHTFYQEKLDRITGTFTRTSLNGDSENEIDATDTGPCTRSAWTPFSKRHF